LMTLFTFRDALMQPCVMRRRKVFVRGKARHTSPCDIRADVRTNRGLILSTRIDSAATVVALEIQLFLWLNHHEALALEFQLD
jgi:hypothetical protein